MKDTEGHDLTHTTNAHVDHNKDFETDEDAVCCVCFNGEVEDDNNIIFCDKCNIAVHQACYGVGTIPPGDWFCMVCQKQAADTAVCCLCPNQGGAMKQTDDGRWAHVTCGLWIPEVKFADPDLMETLTGLDKITPARWKLLCSLCKDKKGACIQCSAAGCCVPFHPLCAMQAKLRMEVKDSGTGDVYLHAFCAKHVNEPAHIRKKYDTSVRESQSLSQKGAVVADVEEEDDDDAPPKADTPPLPKHTVPVLRCIVEADDPPQSFSDSEDEERAFWGMVNKHFEPLQNSDLNRLILYEPDLHTHDPAFFLPPLPAVSPSQSSLSDSLVPSSMQHPTLRALLGCEDTCRHSCATLPSLINARPISMTCPHASADSHDSFSTSVLRAADLKPRIAPGSDGVERVHIIAAAPLVGTVHTTVLIESTREDCAALCDFTSAPLRSPRHEDELPLDRLSVKRFKSPPGYSSPSSSLPSPSSCSTPFTLQSVHLVRPDSARIRDGSLGSASAALSSSESPSDARVYDLERELLTVQEELRQQILGNDSVRQTLRSRLHRGHLEHNHQERMRWASDLEKLHALASSWQMVRLSIAHSVKDQPFFERPADASHDETDYSVCCVCFGGEPADDNPIVFCESCNISVHKACYGIRDVPEDDWFCDRCVARERNRPRGGKQVKREETKDEYLCALCSMDGGALKPTDSGEWAHIVCGLWTAGASIADPRTMEPITGVQQAVHDRRIRNGVCAICKRDHGGGVFCSSEGCTTCFHPLCAWYEGLYMKVHLRGVENPHADVYCHMHTPLEGGGVKRNVMQQKDMRNRGRLDMNVKSKQRRKKRMSHAKEDIYELGRCAVCFETEMGPDNGMIHCDECEIDVHQKCYGVTHHSAGSSWLCRRCESKHDKFVTCVLCPRKGGAFKPTNDGRWAHVACAEWIPEADFGNRETMEPIVGVDMVSRDRRNLKCYLCKRVQGACIQCADHCFEAFHVLCALFAGSYMSIKKETEFGKSYVACCRKHTPLHLARGITLPESFVKLVALRHDLDRARTLVDLCRKREKIQKNLLRTDMDVFEEQLRQLDPPEVKRRPRSNSVVPVVASADESADDKQVITADVSDNADEHDQCSVTSLDKRLYEIVSVRARPKRVRTMMTCDLLDPPLVVLLRAVHHEKPFAPLDVEETASSSTRRSPALKSPKSRPPLEECPSADIIKSRDTPSIADDDQTDNSATDDEEPSPAKKSLPAVPKEETSTATPSTSSKPAAVPAVTPVNPARRRGRPPKSTPTEEDLMSKQTRGQKRRVEAVLNESAIATIPSDMSPSSLSALSSPGAARFTRSVKYQLQQYTSPAPSQNGLPASKKRTRAQLESTTSVDMSASLLVPSSDAAPPKKRVRVSVSAIATSSELSSDRAATASTSTPKRPSPLIDTAGQDTSSTTAAALTPRSSPRLKKTGEETTTVTATATASPSSAATTVKQTPKRIKPDHVSTVHDADMSKHQRLVQNLRKLQEVGEPVVEVLGNRKVGDIVYVEDKQKRFKCVIQACKIAADGQQQYFVHFFGWNKRHDKWITADLLLESDTDSDDDTDSHPS